ncbi:LamG-like jellyroll fold domain-containing protein [Sphaerisporangium aureirubrum]|uniref:LamG-like jellyroll fold domain-containing protein n=1 Tax=Sphaerisporangium aureirubrum TaxID=1544736 RepID=A0ABW1NTZ5_9ACTN
MTVVLLCVGLDTPYVRAATESAVPIETPRQWSGSAAGLPHLVPSEVTRARGNAFLPVGMDKRPKGALPLEVRHQMLKEPAKGGLEPPPSKGPAAARSSSPSGAELSEGECHYPRWASTVPYSTGRIVSYFNVTQGMTEPHDFEATRNSQGSPPLTTTAWRDLGPCYVAPEPEPPTFYSFWPGDDALVGSLAPALGTWASSATSRQVLYAFQVCSGSGPSGSWDWCEGSGWTSRGTWDVPTGRLRWGGKYWWSVTAEDTSNGLTDTSPWMTFTPQPEQPVINSLLASGSGGREFNHVVGNYTQTVTDASVSVVGPPLTATRTYNSLDPRADGMFGAGWSTRWDMRVVDEPHTQTLLVTYPDGSQMRFGASGGGDYVPPQGTYATLATVSGGGWRLMDKSSTTYLFDAQGRLVRVTDNRGRAQDLVYGSGGKLTRVTATGGRSLTFTWNGAHVSGVSTDPVNGTPLTWSYTHDGDKLVKVCGPASAGACTDYQYGAASRYSTSVLNSVPQGYWRLNEPTGGQGAKVAGGLGWLLGSGDANFSSGAFDAVLGVPGAPAGSPDTAVEFRGTSASSSHVTLPHAAVSGRGSHLSVEAWVKTTGSGVVLGHSNSSDSVPDNYTPLLYIGTDGRLRGQFWNGQAAPITSAGPVNNGQWHHVALTGDGGTQTLYLDGTAVGSLNGPIDHRDQFYTRIGSGYSSSAWPASTGATQVFPFKGQIDEVAVYGRRLSSVEVREHFEAGAAAPQMSRVTMPSGRTWASNSYAVDSGRLLTHTDSNGGQWKLGGLQYTQGGEGDPEATITVTDPHNGTLVSVHDALRAFRTTSQTDQLAKATRYEYDTGGYLGKVTDRNGNVTELYHNERGNLIGRKTCESSTSCQTEHYAYHENTIDRFDPRNDQMIISRDARSSGPTDNAYATTWEYTPQGEVAKETTPATPDFPTGRSSVYTYTDGTESAAGGGTVPAGLLKSERDANGKLWSYGYTAQGDLALQTDPTGLVTTYVRDALGRVTSSTEVWEEGAAGASSASTASQPGLVAAYGFEAGSGSVVADDSGNAHAGTATGTSWNSSGRFGKALSFNGTSSWVTVPDAPGFRLTQGMTLMAWVKPAELDGWRNALIKEYSGGLSYALYASDGTVPNAWAVNTSGTEGAVASADGLPLDTWSHIATTYDGTKLRFYVDGDLAAESDLTGSLREDGGPFRIGGNSVWGEHFSGAVDEVRVYDRALPEAEIRTARDTPVVEDEDPEEPPQQPGSATTTVAYDPQGRLASQTGQAVKNEVTGVTHTAQSRFTYTADGYRLTDGVVDLTGGDPEQKITYGYDDFGRITSVTGPEGGVVHYTWDHTGAQTSMVDELGTTYHYTYTPRGEPASTILKNWTGSPVSPQAPRDVVMESASYDPEGRLAAQVDAMGRKLSFTYLGNDALFQVTADDARLNGSGVPRDVVLEEYTYDAAGYLKSRKADGGGTRVDYVYDTAGRLTSETFDPAGLARKTSYIYDASDNVVKETSSKQGDSRTESVEYGYDDAGQLIRRTIENGQQDLITTWTLDRRGLTREIVDPRGNAQGGDAGAYTSSFRYDVMGRLVEAASPAVVVEKEGTAVTASTTEKYGYDNAGGLTHRTDAEGRITRSDHDRAGRTTRVTFPSYTPPGGSSLTPTVAYDYDLAGRLTRFTDERGQIFRAEYDALGNAVRVTDPGPGGQPGGQWVTEYDLLGEPLATVDPTGARDEATYDGLGRVTTATNVERRPSNAAYTTTYEYNDAGDLTKRVEPGDRITRYLVNAAGEVTTETNPAGKDSTFFYDLAGRLVKVTDPLRNSTVAEYDLAGRQTAAKDLNASGTVLRTLGFGYDPASNLISETSAEGRTVQRKYDATDRLVELIEPVKSGESITTTFGYDGTGAPTRTTDGRGNAVWTTYNSLGLVESLTEPATAAHPNAADRTWTNAYDAAGNLLSTLHPGGVRIDRQYDHLNRQVGMSGSGAEAATAPRTYGYDLAGRQTAIGDYALEYNDRDLPTKVTKSSAQVAAFSYDAVGNVTNRADASGAAVFGWDKNDRVATATDPVTGRSFVYGYDDADRLTTLTSAAPQTTQTFAYDDLDRLTSHTLKNSAGAQIAKIGYGWDKDDLLVSKTTEGTTGAGANTYGYDQAGRLTSWTAPNGNVTSYTWDASGNRVRAGADTYVYDQRNRLTSGAGSDYTYSPRGTLSTATTAGVTRALVFDAFDRMVADGDATYGYDALGRLASRVRAGAEQRFSYAGLENDIVAVTNGAGVVQAKYGRDAAGAPISLQEGGGPALGILADQHDDVVGTFSGTALVDSTAYDPFGTATSRSGTTRSLGYQGEWTDPFTGAVNMHARWYQPGTGQFTSRDDLTFPGDPSAGLNRYTYVEGSPLTGTDPSGHAKDYGGGSGGVPRWYRTTPKMRQQARTQRINNQKRTKADRQNGNDVRREKTDSQKRWKKNEERKKYYKQQDRDYKRRNETRKMDKEKKQALSEKKQMRKRALKCQRSPKARGCPGYKAPNSRGNRANGNGPRNSTVKPKGQSGNKPKGGSGNKPGSKPGGKPGGKPKGNSSGTNGNKPGGGKPPTTKNPTKTDYDPDDLPESCEISVAACFNDLVNPLNRPCSGIRGCVKDLIEDVIDDVVNNFIGQTGPDLPIAPPGTDAACPGGNSFIAGTLVLMADGTHKPIEDIKVGDQVQATDPQTAHTASKPVTTLITGDGLKQLVTITVDIDGPHGPATDTLTATAGHPFWLPQPRKWLTAADLQPGMWLQTSAGTWVQVSALRIWTAQQRVYNLTVSGLHTYHVVAGNRAILVHNDGLNPFKKRQKRSGESWPPVPNATVRDLEGLGLPDVDGSKRSRETLKELRELDDDELMDAVLQPHGGPHELMGLYAHGDEVAQGNHRAHELLRRAADPSHNITYETQIYLRNFNKGCQ